VGQKMAELFDQLSRPAAVNISLQWPTSVEAWPARVPDLYHGQPLAVAVNFGATPPVGEVLVQGQVNGVAWSRRLQLGSGLLGEAQASHNGVATLWARRKIEGLLDNRYRGADEITVRAAVLPVALQHQLLSPYTSFIAVEELVARPEGTPLKKRPVPNARPLGQSHQAFAYPATATTGPAKLWFGAMAMFLSLLLHLLRRTESDSEYGSGTGTGTGTGTGSGSESER
jgi:Ca-activated chloride channel family protein